MDRDGLSTSMSLSNRPAAALERGDPGYARTGATPARAGHNRQSLRHGVLRLSRLHSLISRKQYAPWKGRTASVDLVSPRPIH